MRTEPVPSGNDGNRESIYFNLILLVECDNQRASLSGRRVAGTEPSTWRLRFAGYEPDRTAPRSVGAKNEMGSRVTRRDTFALKAEQLRNIRALVTSTDISHEFVMRDQRAAQREEEETGRNCLRKLHRTQSLQTALFHGEQRAPAIRE